MSVAPGTRLGPYEIIAPVGSGGMGEVFRARDTRLGRDVALKILPEIFAIDTDRVARFEREAKALAALNHPNIAHVYDAGRFRPEGAPASQGSEVVFMAMELVDGEDLAQIISRGPVAVPEAIRIAGQIAAGLEAAHDAGIIHRDLKPANVKVKDDGTVKVLDFGLAKAIATDGAVSSASAMNSPTLTARGTELGMIIGTAAYMAPEQARGKPVDRRADLWALGVVLYEMLTGKRAFEGPEVSDVLASVLKETPSLDALPPGVPPAVKRLLRRTLEKDRAKRLDSMAAARLDLEETEAPPAQTTPAPSSRRTNPVALIAIAVAALVIGAVAASFYYSRRTPPPAAETVVISQIAAPQEVISAFHDGYALSPDGTTLAFAARNHTGLRQLWLRRLDAETVRVILGTDGAEHPFWSPDSKSLGFFADDKLKRVDTDGGRLQTLCDTPGLFRSGSWNANDEILWGSLRGPSTRVVKISAAGGTPAPLNELGIGTAPAWLADGRHFLYAGGEKEWGLRIGSSTGPGSAIIASTGDGQQAYSYAAGLVFLNRNDTLIVQRLDEAAGKLVGSAIPIALTAGTPKEWFAVSSDGHRVVAHVRASAGETGTPGDPMARLIWVDRQGNTLGTLGDPGHYWTLRLTPDGRNAIVNPSGDIWMLKPDGRHTRLTTSPKDSQSYNGIPSRDGTEFVFSMPGTIVRRSLNAQGTGQTVGNERGFLQDWSPDGRWLLSQGAADSNSTSTDLLLYDLQNQSIKPWLATDFNEAHGRFSPDGKWVVYSSNVSGRFEVYVRPFEGDAQPIPVSTAGGDLPLWRRDNELFYLDPGDAVMSVSLTRSGSTITPGKPQQLFRIPLNDITRSIIPPYDVTPDGQRFILNVPDRPTPMFFLQGLDALLNKK